VRHILCRVSPIRKARRTKKWKPQSECTGGPDQAIYWLARTEFVPTNAAGSTGGRREGGHSDQSADSSQALFERDPPANGVAASLVHIAISTFAPVL
jgi:hypothetical protein